LEAGAFWSKSSGEFGKKIHFIFFACIGSALKSLAAGCEGDEEAHSVGL